MAELLVCAVDTPGALRYKKGDVVALAPDGHVWGAREGLPTFWQLTVVSIVESDRTSLLADDRIPDAAILDPSLLRLRRRRKRFIDITKLSNLTRTRLANTGKATVLRAALLTAITLRA